MRNIGILIACLLLTTTGFAHQGDFSTPKKVIIAGKVNNLTPDNHELKIYVHKLGFGQDEIHARADSLGNFQASFETYTPTDVWILYKTNFLVLVYPGDSIHVEFDGQPNQRPHVLETIRFTGDRAKTNHDAARFQSMFFSNPFYYDFNAKNRAKETYDVDRYLLYLDTVQQRINEIYNNFMVEVDPDSIVRIWAKTFIEQNYYDELSWYPMYYLRANDLQSGEWAVPDNYYDALLTRLPIEENMFVSGYAMMGFINRFHYNYSRSKIWEEEQNKQYRTPEGHITGTAEIMDSLHIYGIIKYTPDTLLRQMVLTEYFQQIINSSGIRLYERNKNIVDEYIVEPFLREPLLKLYTEVKDRIENPVLATNAYLNKLENTSAQQLFDTILAVNKGKVIYVDCWATWCGPCKAEKPNSKRLMEELKEKDVAFVYLCIDSEEELWKANLAEFQIGGQHYFLTREQSNDLRRAFEIRGIPHYFLIDQEGVIVEKGSHIRPNSVKERILGLLAK
jgi:thiol-disulfide isomerase/thioredoxin